MVWLNGVARIPSTLVLLMKPKRYFEQNTISAKFKGVFIKSPE
jgi:hypothetical protein